MRKAGFVYKCRRCGCFSPLEWPDGDLGLAMHNAVKRASREGDAGMYEGPRFIGMHKCDPLEMDGIEGMGIADLIGYDEAELDGQPPPKPKPPLDSVINESDCGDKCPKCGSTQHRKWISGKVLGCINEKCDNYINKKR